MNAITKKWFNSIGTTVKDKTCITNIGCHSTLVYNTHFIVFQTRLDPNNLRKKEINIKNTV